MVLFQVKGDTGIKLQYTHCRLHSLERENAAISPAKSCDPEVLREEEVTLLLKELAKFQDVLHLCCDQLEACVLTTYLFHLW